MIQQQREQLPSQSFSKDVQRYKHSKNQADLDERGKKTIQAFGEGLTAIERQNEDDSLGNIYTDALPPWMLPDVEESNSSGVIGPTMEDLEKHRKLEKKKLLPACRVGAKFDHKTDQSDTWLPDFGGVWSHGRRTNSVQQFKRRQSKMKTSSHWTSSTSSSTNKPSSPSYSFVEHKTEALPWGDGKSRDVVLESPQEASNSSFSLSTQSSTTGVSFNSNQQSNLHITYGHSYHTNHVSGNISHLQSDGQLATSSRGTVKPYVRKMKSPPNGVSSYATPSILPHDSYRTFQTHELYEDSQHYNYGHHGNNHSMASPYQVSPSVSGMGAGSFSSYKRTRHQPTATHLLADSTQGDHKTFRLLETPVLNQTKK